MSEPLSTDFHPPCECFRREVRIVFDVPGGSQRRVALPGQMQNRRLAYSPGSLREVPDGFQPVHSLLAHFVRARKMDRANVIEGKHPRFKEIEKKRHVAILQFYIFTTSRRHSESLPRRPSGRIQTR